MTIHYEVDPYVQEHYQEGSATINGVCSWRLTRRHRREELSVDFHNGWIFDSASPLVGPISDAKLAEAVEHLRRIERGQPKRAFSPKETNGTNSPII
jgi:hypothetical protein